MRKYPKTPGLLKQTRTKNVLATRMQVLIPVAAAAVIVGAAGMLSIPADTKMDFAEFPRGTIRVDETVLEVQIADTQPRRVLGLMHQNQLPYDEGMIFIFDSVGQYSMWMRNVQFALDMVWFDENGVVVHIERDVPPCLTAIEAMTCPSINPEVNALYILEVTAGFVEMHDVRVGSQLHLISV